MYEQFYKLRGKPFSLLPDGNCLYLSRHHRRVMNLLEYAADSQSGFVVITGEVGSGKTTVIRNFLKRQGADVVVGVITNPSPHMGSLLNWIAGAFDFADRSADDARLYQVFVEFLLAQYAAGKRTTLIIDEAQNLPADKLEELRMLSNVNNEQDMLLQVILVGQPELLEALKQPELRQFKQRIAVHCHLGLLPPHEVANFIHYRLSLVGGSKKIFDDAACALVAHLTGGVPRLINLLCDQALVYGFSEDLHELDLPTIASVVVDREESGLNVFFNTPESLSPSYLKTASNEELMSIRMARV